MRPRNGAAILRRVSPSIPKQAIAFSSPQEITALLRAWNAGDEAAVKQLTPLVYQELHRLAHRPLAGERQAHSLQMSALVNKAYPRLVDAQQVDWQNRAHFFGVSARLMRQILVDFARQRDSQKRGGDEAIFVSLAAALDTPVERPLELVALDDALMTLARLDARPSQRSKLRFIDGLSLEESAEVLSVPPGTIMRD